MMMLVLELFNKSGFKIQVLFLKILKVLQASHAGICKQRSNMKTRFHQDCKNSFPFTPAVSSSSKSCVASAAANIPHFSDHLQLVCRFFLQCLESISLPSSSKSRRSAECTDEANPNCGRALNFELKILIATALSLLLIVATLGPSNNTVTPFKKSV